MEEERMDVENGFSPQPPAKKMKKLEKSAAALTPEEQRKRDKEMVVTDPSVPSFTIVEFEEEHWENLEGNIGRSFSPFKYEESVPPVDRVCLLTTTREINGVHFEAAFYRPNLREDEWEAAAAAGSEKMTCVIKLMPEGMRKKYGEEVWVKWNGMVFVDVDEDRYHGPNLEMGFGSGDVHSTASNGFEHEIEMGSYSYAVNVDNGYRMRSRGWHLQFSIFITICSTSFSLPTIERELGRANVDSDICLRAEGQLFYTSKFLLSLHSDVFRTMFTSEFREKNAKVIDITDADAHSLKALLMSIYPEGIEITNNNVEALLSLAHRFDVTKTIQECYDYLMKDSDKNYFLRCRLADQYNYIYIFDKAVEDMYKQGIKMNSFYSELNETLKLRILNGIAEVSQKEGEKERNEKWETENDRSKLRSVLQSLVR